MKTTSAQRRAYNGPIFFSLGFRPFFFGAGLWAAVAMTLWVVFLAVGLDVPSHLSGVDWHLHEFVFGYTSAVIAGFLLTAVPNWTGRMPVMGWPVAALAGLWLAGRVALLFSAYLPPFLAPLIDLSFIAVLALIIAREIVAGKNWRNLKVLIILALIGGANGLFHYEAIMSAGFDGYGIRAGVALIIMLIMVVGGRIIPSFTRNWLMRQPKGRLPAPMNNLDKGIMVASAVALVVWVAMPESAATRPLAALAGVLNLVRLSRWVGWRTLAEPLLAILHIGFFFIPYGFLTIAAGDLLPGWYRASQIPHAFTAGAIGLVTLAMLTRTSLGHSGRPLAATKTVTTIYALVLLGVLTRMAGEFLPDVEPLLHAAATFWILGFGLFALSFIPIFFKPRVQKMPNLR
ncbi:MAG TPA: short-chain dehydrogenase [Rhodobacteraceae bacterium]|nr:short-chain dehydrogenase [Paracoccaceae bacterium]